MERLDQQVNKFQFSSLDFYMCIS